MRICHLGESLVVLCAPVLRIYFKKLLEKFIPGILVLSYNEIETDVELEIMGMISA